MDQHSLLRSKFAKTSIALKLTSMSEEWINFLNFWKIYKSKEVILINTSIYLRTSINSPFIMFFLLFKNFTILLNISRISTSTLYWCTNIWINSLKENIKKFTVFSLILTLKMIRHKSNPPSQLTSHKFLVMNLLDSI
jgi:hypothetical protein